MNRYLQGDSKTLDENNVKKYLVGIRIWSWSGIIISSVAEIDLIGQ